MKKKQLPPQPKVSTGSTSGHESRRDDSKHVRRDSSVSTRRESLTKSIPRESITSTRRDSISSPSSHTVSDLISTPNCSSDLSSSTKSTSKGLKRTKSTINTVLNNTAGSNSSLRKVLNKTSETSKSNTSLMNFFESKKTDTSNLKTSAPKPTTTSINEENIVEQLNEITKELATNKILSQQVRTNSPLRDTTNMDDKLKKLANILSLETNDTPVKTTVVSPIKNQKDETSPIIINNKLNSTAMCSLIDDDTKDHKPIILDESERTVKKRKREPSDIENNINQSNILDILQKYKTTTKKEEKSPFLTKSPLPKLSTSTKEKDGASSLQKHFSKKLNAATSDNDQESDTDLDDLTLPSSMSL